MLAQLSDFIDFIDFIEASVGLCGLDSDMKGRRLTFTDGDRFTD